VTGPEIRRSLYLHAPIRRMPHRVLQQVLDHLPADTPPDGPDGPVALLERRIAELLGTPAALFFPTGTMAQQSALRVHAERRGRFAFAAHPRCHLAVWEQQGHAVVHGLRFHPVGDANTLLTVDDLDAVGERLAALVLELPQRDIGGQLPDWAALRAQVAWARDRGAAAHLDGARLWEAQPYYDRPHAEIAGLFDTAYVSLYKGLQGARGAVLAGDDEFLAEAAVWRQRLGGKLPDAWPLAAVALVGLDELLPRMPAFRDHAVALAAAINADDVARTVPEVPLTPLFHVHLPVAPAAVEQAHADLLAAAGTQVFGYLRSASDPGRCSFEITVGENAMEFTPDEVAALVRDLVTRSEART
jgi:threonine aldolase